MVSQRNKAPATRGRDVEVEDDEVELAVAYAS